MTPHARDRRRRPVVGAPRRARLPAPLARGPGRRRGPRGHPRHGRRTPAAVAAAVDTVAGVRQFENSSPVPARRSAARTTTRGPWPAASAQAPRAPILEVTGGQGPQHLVNEFAAAIAAGRATSCCCSAPRRSPPSSTTRQGGDEGGQARLHRARRGQPRGPRLRAQGTHLRAPGRARAQRRAQPVRADRQRPPGQAQVDPAEYAAAIGALFAPFTPVAAANPHASAPVERSAAELVTPTEANRPIADPYTRYIVAREKVNQGAAVLLMSVAAAQRLGVPEDRWVFLHGHADLRERPLMERADLSRSPAAVLAARHALEMAGIKAGDLAAIDLYSCFPAPVFNICEGLRILPDDPRGLTLTGGLPFFGGAGNNYSMHAIAETVQRARSQAGIVRVRRCERRHHEQVLGRGVQHDASLRGSRITARSSRTRSTAGRPPRRHGTPTDGRPSRPTRSSTPATEGGQASSSAGSTPTGGASSPVAKTRNCSACSPPKSRLAAGYTRGRSEQETKSPAPKSG